MKITKIPSKISFIISSITSMIFVGYFGYKGFMVYFVQKAMDDTFIGGSSSDITVTLWFAISGAMALSMLLFFQFIKIKDLKSQSTILKRYFYWMGRDLCCFDNFYTQLYLFHYFNCYSLDSKFVVFNNIKRRNY